jgi:dCMP deaminase
MTDQSYTRPSWDEYFLEIVAAVGRRGTCDRGRSGSVITRDNRILTTGYVGAPSGLPHCDEVGHQMKTVTHEDGTTSRHCLRTVHAEQNAINQAAREGISLKGATIYCNMMPCAKCAQSIINVGIKRLVALKDYHSSQEGKDLFEAARVQWEVITDEEQSYSDK